MMKFALPAAAAALLLAGCSKTESTTVEPGTMAEDTSAQAERAAPVATETVVATPGATMTADDGTTTVTTGPNGTAVKVDGRDVDGNAGPDGVTATVTPNP